MTKFLRVCLVVTSAIGCSGAIAQSAAPIDPNTVVVPAVSCEQPPKRAPLGATPRDQDRFKKQVNAYQKCMQEYAKSMEDTAKLYEAVAQKYLDSGNKAIGTYNDYLAEVNKNQED
jgi:hypothetical protein